jgi:hypothetical protein
MRVVVIYVCCCCLVSPTTETYLLSLKHPCIVATFACCCDSVLNTCQQRVLRVMQDSDCETCHNNFSECLISCLCLPALSIYIPHLIHNPSILHNHWHLYGQQQTRQSIFVSSDSANENLHATRVCIVLKLSLTARVHSISHVYCTDYCACIS